MAAVTGKAFRKAIRDDRFGDDDPERVFTLTVVPNPAAIDQFCKEIETRLEPPNTAVIRKDVKDQPDFVAIYILSEFEKAGEDFGEESEVVMNETLHSFVNKKTGNVYLPAPTGGVCLEYGARCNVNVEASYGHALQSKGMMLPFKGGARVLLELGVGVDSCDAWGETALMHACFLLNQRAIKWLLQKGADPSLTTKGSLTTALHRTVEAQGSDETKCGIIKLLNHHKVNVNAQNAWGATALHIAALLRLPETSQLLLSMGASRNLTDSNGRSPAVFAVPKSTESESSKVSAAKVLSVLQVS